MPSRFARTSLSASSERAVGVARGVRTAFKFLDCLAQPSSFGSVSPSCQLQTKSSGNGLTLAVLYVRLYVAIAIVSRRPAP
eukprot:5338208-Prymnesium_polylepis.1